MAKVLSFTLLCLFAVAAPLLAQSSCNGVGAVCSLEDLGNNRYRLTFVVHNQSPDPLVIFKWRVDPPNIPGEWVTVGFEIPPDWSGNHPSTHLDFQTPNGDGRPNRVYSPSASGCGSTPLTFKWTFDNVGGPVPDCGAIDPALDYTFHVQGVNAATCANVGQSFTCSGVVAVETSTWGAIKSVYQD